MRTAQASMLVILIASLMAPSLMASHTGNEIVDETLHGVTDPTASANITMDGNRESDYTLYLNDTSREQPSAPDVSIYTACDGENIYFFIEAITGQVYTAAMFFDYFTDSRHENFERFEVADGAVWDYTHFEQNPNPVPVGEAYFSSSVLEFSMNRTSTYDAAFNYDIESGGSGRNTGYGDLSASPDDYYPNPCADQEMQTAQEAIYTAAKILINLPQTLAENTTTIITTLNDTLQNINITQYDDDGDGTPDRFYVYYDANGNGTKDADEIGQEVNPDAQGVIDTLEAASSALNITQYDDDGDGTPDRFYVYYDANGNGTKDADETGQEVNPSAGGAVVEAILTASESINITQYDDDGDGTPDRFYVYYDANGNGTKDADEIGQEVNPTGLDALIAETVAIIEGVIEDLLSQVPPTPGVPELPMADGFTAHIVAPEQPLNVSLPHNFTVQSFLYNGTDYEEETQFTNQAGWFLQINAYNATNQATPEVVGQFNPVRIGSEWVITLPAETLPDQAMLDVFVERYNDAGGIGDGRSSHHQSLKEALVMEGNYLAADYIDDNAHFTPIFTSTLGADVPTLPDVDPEPLVQEVNNTVNEAMETVVELLSQDPNATVNETVLMIGEVVYDVNQQVNIIEGTLTDNKAPNATIESLNGLNHTEKEAIQLAVSAEDPEGDNFTWELRGNFTAEDNSTVEAILASGNQTTANQTHLVVLEDVGTYRFTYTVMDASHSNSTNLTAHAAPYINEAPAGSIAVDHATGTAPHTFNVTIAATDVEGDDLTWDLFENNISIKNGTQADLPHVEMLTKAEGTYVYKFQVADAQNQSNYETTVTVDPTPNEAPLVSLTTDKNNLRAPFNATLTMAATDAESDPLTWKLLLEDTQIMNGTTLPATLQYNFSTADIYQFRLVVNDTHQEANDTLTVVAIGNADPAIMFNVTQNSTNPPAFITIKADALDEYTASSNLSWQIRENNVMIANEVNNSLPYEMNRTLTTAGTYNYTFQVYDEDGGVAMANETIVLINPTNDQNNTNDGNQTNDGNDGNQTNDGNDGNQTNDGNDTTQPQQNYTNEEQPKPTTQTTDITEATTLHKGETKVKLTWKEKVTEADNANIDRYSIWALDENNEATFIGIVLRNDNGTYEYEFLAPTGNHHYYIQALAADEHNESFSTDTANELGTADIKEKPQPRHKAILFIASILMGAILMVTILGVMDYAAGKKQ